jgi:hypothetical protein
MKRSIKIILHAGFWLFVPVVASLLKWAEQTGSFFGLPDTSESYPRIVLGIAKSIFIRHEQGAPLLTAANLSGFLVDFCGLVIYPVAMFYLFYGYFTRRIGKGTGLSLYLLPLLFLFLIPYGSVTVLSMFHLGVHLNYTYYLILGFIVTLFFSASGFCFYLFEFWIRTEKISFHSTMNYQ